MTSQVQFRGWKYNVYISMSGDTHVLRGIGAIVNPTNTKSGVNYEQIANSMITNGVIDKPRDPTESFDVALKDMMRDMHLNFDTPSKSTTRAPTERPSDRPPATASFKTPYGGAPTNSSSSSDSESDDSRESSRSSPRSPPPRSPPPKRSPPPHHSARRSTPRHSARHSSPRHSASRHTPRHSTPRHSGGGRVESPRVKEFRHPNYENPQPTYNHGSEYHKRTVEEDRHVQIHNVMRGMGGDGEHIFNLENEKVEDVKAQMLVDIEFMKSALESEDIDVDKYPKLDSKSNYRDVEDLQKILRLKLDRIRYSSLADDFILTGASLVEDIFDGERVWFGRYRPNMKDWSKQVQAKLRRMRHDTSTITGGVMNNYNIGPFSRLCLELVPNGFLYAKKNNPTPARAPTTPTSRESMSKSISSIRDISDR